VRLKSGEGAACERTRVRESSRPGPLNADRLVFESRCNTRSRVDGLVEILVIVTVAVVAVLVGVALVFAPYIFAELSASLEPHAIIDPAKPVLGEGRRPGNPCRRSNSPPSGSPTHRLFHRQ
jgi:hypothetical protein